MKKRFVLIILSFFTFINSVHSKNESGIDNKKIVYNNIDFLFLENYDYKLFSDFTNNTIIHTEEEYLIVGNADGDFKSIKYFTDKYCVDKLGINFNAILIKISYNVAYVNCQKISVLDEYNLTPIEMECFFLIEEKIENYSYKDNCKKINKNLKLVLAEVIEYKKKIEALSSNAFIYRILSPDISKKIDNFELIVFQAKTSKSSIYPLPVTPGISDTVKNKVILNIKLCKLYGFITGSNPFNKCILTLINNKD